MKKIAQSFIMKLPTGEVITTGPGTVPTSHEAPKDALKKMIKAAREVSKAGIFGQDTHEYGNNL